MRRDDLAVGLAVAYIGEDQQVFDWGAPVLVGVLRGGHPGRVTDVGNGFHVIVAWVGLEEADVSQVVGWGCSLDGRWMPGLARLSEAEYQRRATALADKGT